MSEKNEAFNVDAVAYEENFVIDTQFLIHDIMRKKNIAKADLAKLMGVSKSRLSHIFGADANLTLRTIAKMAFALDVKLDLVLKQDRARPTLAVDGGWSQLAVGADLEKISSRSFSAKDWAVNDNRYSIFEVSVSDEDHHEFSDSLAEAA